ncbi:hypothetical protein [Microcoleus sp. AT3-D2]
MKILRRDRLNQLLKGIPPTSYGFDNFLSVNRAGLFHSKQLLQNV